MMEETVNVDEWFYVDQLDRVGPLSTEQMNLLLQENKINLNTKVWKVGTAPEWVPISKTALAKYSSTPPPLTGDAVANSIVWWLAFVPIIGLIVENAYAYFADRDVSSLWWITVAFNVVLCIYDENVLKKSGNESVSPGWALLVPLYLFFRAKKLRQKPTYGYVWLATFALSVFFPSQILSTIPALGGNQETVAIVRDGTFNDHKEMTVGKAAKSFFEDSDWESFLDDGKEYVNLEGSMNEDGIEENIVMQFIVDTSDRTFYVYALEIDGEPQNKAFINEFIDEMFP